MNYTNLSVEEKLGIMVNTILAIFAILSFVGSLNTGDESNYISMLFPILNGFTIVHWRIIFGIVVLLIIWVNFAIPISLKKKVILLQPHLELVSCGTDNVLQNISLYGNESYVGRDARKRSIIYFDIANVLPEKRDKDISTAYGISFSLKFRDYEDGSSMFEYIGKWVSPENKKSEYSIDIPPDGVTRRIGVGFMDYEDGTIWLLDSSKAYFSDSGTFSSLKHLSKYGKYVVIAEATGRNVWDTSLFYFELENIEGESLKFSEMNDGEEWYQRAVQSEKDYQMSLWKNNTNN